ncbi:cytochrome c peroxidase [Agrobacterium vitis]|nr:cytochrome c peroxidase [Agrobacterium vitis]MBE1439677.1 cytochrome c peroxidase [Agrobacterium vitis]
MVNAYRKSGLTFLTLAGLCLAGATPGLAAQNYQTTNPQIAPLSAVAKLGKAMFYDQSLSGSGTMSCASCHDPAHHYAPANRLAVQRGGLHLDKAGIRSAPSLAYTMATPPFSVGVENSAEEAAEAAPMAEASGIALAAQAAPVAGPLAGQPVVKAVAAANNAVPQGGMFWDGRVDSLEEQALGPLLSPFEMANRNEAELYQKIRDLYGPQLTALFGAQVVDDRSMMLSEVGFALARYQVEDADFHPYSSKYDAYLRGNVQLSAAEARGLKLFDDPQKGNCASCHLDKMTGDGQMPNFTDYEYEALGLPRNPAIAANDDPTYFDRGLCGPLRQDDFAKQPQNCGLFKTPTLRNVAERHVYFHNGVYHTLEDAIRFYVARDTDPASIYPAKADGTVDKFNDMPDSDKGNIDVIDAPMDRKPGQPPALNEADIKDVVAFLKTLTDGWDAQKP